MQLYKCINNCVLFILLPTLENFISEHQADSVFVKEKITEVTWEFT